MGKSLISGQFSAHEKSRKRVLPPALGFRGYCYYFRLKKKEPIPNKTSVAGSGISTTLT